MTTIRVKIIDAAGVWFASSLMPTGRTPERHVKALNDRAKSRGIHVSYEHATEEQYTEYKISQLATIERRKRG